MHEALARLRRRAKNASLDDEAMRDDDVMIANDRTPEEQVHDRELRRVMEEAIDALPSAFRTVFVMRAVEDMSTTDAAEALGIPEDTVRTRLHRARGLLQAILVKRIEVGAKDAFAFQGARCDRVVSAGLRRIERGEPGRLDEKVGNGTGLD